MDGKLRTADELLELATHALDYVQEILTEHADPTLREQAELVEQCSDLLMHVHQAIYTVHPEVAPAFAKDNTELGRESQEYGRLLLETRELWAAGDHEAALQLWRVYLKAARTFYFETIATRFLKHLEGMAARTLPKQSSS